MTLDSGRAREGVTLLSCVCQWNSIGDNIKYGRLSRTCASIEVMGERLLTSNGNAMNMHAQVDRV